MPSTRLIALLLSASVLGLAGRPARAQQAAGAPPAAPAAPSSAPAAGPEAAASASAPAQSAPAGSPGSAPAPLSTEAQRVAFLLAQQSRIHFGAADRQAALELLRRPAKASELERALALTVLGGDGESSRELLRQVAREGPLLERQAALLALGQRAEAEPALIGSAIADPDPLVASCAWFALLLAGQQPAVEQAVADPNTPRVALAAKALSFQRAPLDNLDFAPGLLWLTLRAQAGAQYTLGEGAPPAPPIPAAPRAAAPAPAALDPEIALRQAVVLQLGVGLKQPSVSDHLLELVLQEGSAPALRAAVARMPAQLARLMLSGLWWPHGAPDWEVLVDEIEQRRSAAQCQDVLRAALGNASTRVRAAALLLGSGVRDARELLRTGPGEENAPVRLLTARAMGQSADAAWLGELAGYSLDPDARVRAAALLAQSRLGYGPANERLRSLAEGKFLATEEEASRAERGAAVAELFAQGQDPALLGWLERFHAASTGADREQLAIRLVGHRRVALRADVRALLASGDAPAHAREALEALARDADARDLAVLADYARAERAPALRAPALRALVAARQVAGLALLRAALWGESWHLSAIAGAVLHELGGATALVDELDSPPERVSDAALRRVGFALGELGGLVELDRLARRRPATDPALQGAYLGALSARTH